MKKMYSLLLIATIFCSTTLPTETPVTKKPILITDFDDVWIKNSSYLSVLAHLKPLKTLIKTNSNKETAPDKINNITLQFLDYGKSYPILAPYIPGLITTIGKSRYINTEINKLYHHLKEEQWPIMIATNKDHYLYDLAIEGLGDDIPNMVNKTFVAEPKNDEAAITQLQNFANEPTTDESYRNLVQKATSLQATKNIIHVPSKKPDQEYFTYVVNNIGADNDMIFIDDNKKNVDAFNALQKDTPKLRLGILYDENNLNQFAEDIKKAGMVSEEKDKKLLDEIRYPGISGKIKQTLQYIFAW